MNAIRVGKGNCGVSSVAEDFERDMLACFQGGISRGDEEECEISVRLRHWENDVSELGNFPKGNGFAKTERGTLLNLTSVKGDRGDLESRVFRELDQAQFGSIETHFYLR